MDPSSGVRPARATTRLSCSGAGKPTPLPLPAPAPSPRRVAPVVGCLRRLGMCRSCLVPPLQTRRRERVTTMRAVARPRVPPLLLTRTSMHPRLRRALSPESRATVARMEPSTARCVVTASAAPSTPHTQTTCRFRGEYCYLLQHRSPSTWGTVEGKGQNQLGLPGGHADPEDRFQPDVTAWREAAEELCGYGPLPVCCVHE